MNSLDEEKNEIFIMIRNTPRVGLDVVSKYHEEIIKKLDCGEIISVPSSEHRNLHQQIWMKGHEIYNAQLNEQTARLNFVKNEQRERFDLWYAKTYILDKKLTDWELKTVIDATKTCMNKYKHPLELLEKEELGV